MPIYAYKCPACGHAKDVLQKISDPAPACAACGQAQMEKQLTAAGFQLKGSGWYQTDFKGSNAASPAAPATCPATGAEGASGSSAAPACPACPAADA